MSVRNARVKVVPDAASLRHEFRVSTGRKAILWRKMHAKWRNGGFLIDFLRFLPVETRNSCLSEAASGTTFRELFFHQFGRPWAQNIGFVDTNRIIFLFFLNFGWKRENLKKKWKKRFFGWAKTGKHGYFCATPTGLPDVFSGFYYFFPVRRHVSDVPFFTDELCRS